MINSEVALNVVIDVVKQVGAVGSDPVITQNKLKDFGILTQLQLDDVRGRIVGDLEELPTPFELNKEFLRNIDSSTQVGTIVGIVIDKAVEIEITP